MFDTANIDKTSVARKSSNMAQVVDIIIILIRNKQMIVV
jgi:hypothetical protein